MTRKNLFVLPLVGALSIAGCGGAGVSSGGGTQPAGKNPPTSISITTTTCPGGTQNTAYAGCTIAVSGGTPPYTFSTNASGNYPTLPEGMSMNASTPRMAKIGAEGR